MTASCTISAEIIRRGFDAITGTQTAADQDRLASALEDLESSPDGIRMADALSTQDTGLYMANGLLRLGLPAAFVPEANALLFDRAIPQPLVASFIIHDGTHAMLAAQGNGVLRPLGDWVDQDVPFLADRMCIEEARALSAQLRFGFERHIDDDGVLLGLLTARSPVMADCAAAYHEAVEGGMDPSQAESALANYIRDQSWFGHAVRTLVERQADLAQRLARPPVGTAGNIREGWDLRLSAADTLTAEAEEGLVSTRLHGSYRRTLSAGGELRDDRIAQDPVLAMLLQTASIGLIGAETGWRQVAEWLRAMPGRESLEAGFAVLTREAEERLLGAAGSLGDGRRGAGYADRISTSMHAAIRLSTAPSLTRRPTVPNLGPSAPPGVPGGGAGSSGGAIGRIAPAGNTLPPSLPTEDEDTANW